GGWRGTAGAAGRGAGRLVGGNLALVAASLGTPWEIDTRGAILLVEDVNEPPYKIDRLLQQLRAAGKLAGLAGLGVGALTDCTDARHPEPPAENVGVRGASPPRSPRCPRLPFRDT